MVIWSRCNNWIVAGPFGDQSFWQRAFTTKRKKSRVIFTFCFSVWCCTNIYIIIGFGCRLGIDAGSNAQLINIITVNELLPKIFLYLLRGCCFRFVSTLDSGLCSISSISTDIIQI